MHYYSHHIGDFKSATSNLDDHQLATYLRMIWAYYDKEKPIQGEIEDIAFAMRSDEKTIRLLLRHFFIETPDGWVNERCQREINAYHSKSDKARNSAKARWNNANAMRTHTERNATEPVFDANQEPITNKQIKDTNTSRSLRVSDLVKQGVDEQVAKDWLTIRKAKRAPLTQTALDGVIREAGKAGIDLPAAILICTERNWQSFKAEWLTNKNEPQQPPRVWL